MSAIKDPPTSVPAEYQPLPELPAPTAANNCQRCELYRQRPRVIWGEGNPKGHIFVLLDNPGAREDAEGNEYVCGTRQTLRQAAEKAGIEAGEMYVTWVLKCRPMRQYDKAKSRAACRPYLEQQLALPQIRVVVCLGNVAVQSFFDDPLAEVKSLRGQVLTRQGRAIICSYHPLAARRRPNLMPLLVADLQLAAREVYANPRSKIEGRPSAVTVGPS